MENAGGAAARKASNGRGRHQRHRRPGRLASDNRRRTRRGLLAR